jgi:hypothetical protein
MVRSISRAWMSVRGWFARPTHPLQSKLGGLHPLCDWFGRRSVRLGAVVQQRHRFQGLGCPREDGVYSVANVVGELSEAVVCDVRSAGTYRRNQRKQVHTWRHARSRARTRIHTHARTNACMHAHARTHTHSNTHANTHVHENTINSIGGCWFS